MADVDVVEPSAVDTAPSDPSHGGLPRGETGLVMSISVENLVAQRNATIARIVEAHRLLVSIEDDAHLTGTLQRPRSWSLDLQFSSGNRGSFTSDRGVALATKRIDAGYWSHLLAQSGLQSFLDAAAREEWRKAIEREDVPVLTVATVEATFAQLYNARGDMFERGVCELFRKLSWHYKTNNPVKLGKRLVLTYAVNGWSGGIEHGASDKLDDIIRVMSMLDGKPEPDHRQAAWHTLNNPETRWMRDAKVNHTATLGPVSGKPYLSIRGYKNRNAHLTFLRLDLVDKMNKIIAKHYPGALPPSSEGE